MRRGRAPPAPNFTKPSPIKAPCPGPSHATTHSPSFSSINNKLLRTKRRSRARPGTSLNDQLFVFVELGQHKVSDLPSSQHTGDLCLSPFCATRTSMAAAAMRMARLVLLLVLLIQILNVFSASARPFKGEGWLDDGIKMVVDMLGDNKSGSNPPSHCC
ncbi:unnamed protein product [Urochloa humidicola]